MRVAVAVILVGLTTVAVADRFPPLSIRDQAIGCWQLAKGQRLVITAFGKHSINARLAGTITTPEAFAPWHAAEASFEIACPRAAKNADFTCRAAPDGDRLAVRVFQLVKDAPPTLIEDLRAARCSP